MCNLVVFQEAEDLVGEGGDVIEGVTYNNDVLPGLWWSVEAALCEQ